MSNENEPRFACDAMLGGLARWLRAAGYDASWSPNIADWDLVRLAIRENRLLLTSDTGIMKIGIIRDGDVPTLFIPHGLGKRSQLAHVLRTLGLKLRQPRCMACGGALAEASRDEIRTQVPPRSFHWMDHFFRCDRCGKVFWQGTHWQRITQLLERMADDDGVTG